MYKPKRLARDFAVLVINNQDSTTTNTPATATPATNRAINQLTVFGSASCASTLTINKLKNNINAKR